jgi:HEPN domain-containing protein
MKITIDEKVCTKHKMTVQEVLIALIMRMGNVPDTMENMLNREILVDTGEYQVTQHWSDVLDEIISDSSGRVEKSDEELLELAKQMRELYPQGKMKDRYGRMTPYYYRCNNSEVVKKLKKFFTIFGNVPDEDILDATKRYVASFQGNYTGMRLIKYFILKDDVKPGEDGNHVEQISDLATFLENKESEEEVGTNDDSWLINVKN